MGKSKKRKNHKQPVPEQHQDPTTNPFQPAAKKAKFQAPSKHSPVPRNNKSSNIPVLLPPQFPPDQTFPQTDFLRNVHPYRESFQKAIETAYEGFAVDEETSKQGYCNKSSLFDHAKIQQSLKIMDDCGLFRTDVTQPFGLGTKCAKTYVTRCLLGEEGTTYKYLGLRMFAHPWCSTTTSRGGIPIKSTNINNSGDDNNYNLEDALGTISKLNERLSERTKFHLDILQDKRRKRLGFNGGQPCIHGRASYDIALINRMTSSPDLKMEPTIGRDKTAVSWHADSSLEHYSR